MYIAILQDDVVENELDIMWHCAECTKQTYDWTDKQFGLVQDAVVNNTPVSVPSDVGTAVEFGRYIKSLKLV